MYRPYRRLFVFSIGLIILGRLAAFSTISPSMLKNEEEYVVFSALIDQMYLDETVRLIVIQNRTSIRTPYQSQLIENLGRVKQAMSALTEETLKDFESKNQESHFLQRLFRLRVNYVLISTREIESYFGEDGSWWQDYHDNYPESQGLIALSSVGFDPSMNQALVYASHQSAGLAGEGFFVLLAKDNNLWRIKGKVKIWIS